MVVRFRPGRSMSARCSPKSAHNSASCARSHASFACFRQIYRSRIIFADQHRPCAEEGRGHYSSLHCGCSSVVEHLLAKEDVASSSLVTRSSFGGGGPPNAAELRLAGQPVAQIRAMYYVCLLQSESHPKQRYIGFTTDLKSRLTDHNNGHSRHTSKFAPWILKAYFAFRRRHSAVAFEKYLKSGSGRAFAGRHVWKS
jgi:putative endonuclease